MQYSTHYICFTSNVEEAYLYYAKHIEKKTIIKISEEKQKENLKLDKN